MRAARAALAATVAAVAVAAVGAGCGSGHGAGRGFGHGAGPLHFASGTNANQKLALSLGFNLVDVTGSQTDPAATKATVDALPDGVQALIWVGNLDNTDCTTPGYETPRFRSLVNALAHDGKVYGYYLSDEPHPLMCTNAAADIRARADYVHARSDSQKTFIVVQDGSSGGSSQEKVAVLAISAWNRGKVRAACRRATGKRAAYALGSASISRSAIRFGLSLA